MNVKIKDKEIFSKKELLLISLLCFMTSEIKTDELILNSARIITNIPDLDDDIGQFVKGVVLLVCDKFVEDELIYKTVSNLVGGNMKIVEDYAQSKVNAVKKELQKELQAKDEELVTKIDELVAKDDELIAKDEEYKKAKRDFVVNLDNEGYCAEDIAKLADVSLEFVSETLSK